MGRIADRMKLIETSGIRRVFDLASRLEKPVNLSIGQPDFDAPDELKIAAIEAICAGHNHYTQTQGILALREAVAEKLTDEGGIDTHPDDVIITSGVMGGLYLASAALFNPGDEVIIMDPYFVANDNFPRVMGAKLVYVNTYPDFLPKTEDIEYAITDKTKAILINSPGNPTGAVYPRGLLESIAELAGWHNLTVISDEIYEDFIYEGEHVSIGSMYEDTITLGGFSKSAGVPGWRIGYATGPRDILAEMKTMQQYTYVCAPAPFQKAIADTFPLDISHHIEEYRGRRDRLYDALSPYYEITKPEGAFYMFPKAPGGSATSFVEKAIENNLLIIPGGVFSQVDTHFRISFAAPDETLDRGIEILLKLAGS